MEPIAVDIYHSQWIEDGTCGAASAQMLIRALKKASQQAVLYCDQCHTPGVTGWRTTPEGLSATLIANDTSNPARYQIVKFATREILTRHVCWLVSNAKSNAQPNAPAVLVHGKLHWVVVNGCKVSRPPISSSDSGYDIESLSIKDPGVPKDAGSTSLTMHQEVPINDWLTTYVNDPVSADEPELTDYRNLWIAIGEAIPPNEFRTTFSSTPIATASPQAGSIDEQTAIELATDALERDSFVEGVSWRTLASTDFEEALFAPRWRDPRFPNDETYFVPIPTAGNTGGCPQYRVVVQIGANGEYRGLAIVPGGGLYLGNTPYMLDPDAIKNQLDNRPFINPATGESFRIGQATNEWGAELSWTPSSVSVSPFLPYYIIEFQTGSGPVNVYLRLDGKYFFDLDTTIAGW